MPLGMEVGLGSSDIVLNRDPAPLEKGVKMVKAFPYSTPSVGPGADPGV